jgi:hypothetical protein
MRSSANHRQPGKGCQFDCQIEWVELLKTKPVLGRPYPIARPILLNL